MTTSLAHDCYLVHHQPTGQRWLCMGDGEVLDIVDSWPDADVYDLALGHAWARLKLQAEGTPQQ